MGDGVEDRARVSGLGGLEPRAWAICASAIAALSYGADLLLNWPGHFGPDASWQLMQGRLGVFNTWHPPVMAALLGLADRIIPGAPLFMALNGAMFYAALLAFALTAARPRAIALGLLALTAASPIVLIYQGTVWKDVLFANASLAGFAALAWAGRLWARRGARLGLLALAAISLALAALSRQSGALVPACAVPALLIIARNRGLGWRRAALHALGLALACVGLIGAASLWLGLHGDGRPETLHQLRRLQTYDIAGMAHAEPGLDLPVLRREAPGLEAWIRTQAAPAYIPAGADNLELLPGADTWMIPETDAGSRQWRALIAAHPLLYLKVRTEAFGYVLATPSAKVCAVVATGVGAEPWLLQGAGLAPRRTARDIWGARYAFSMIGTPVFSHLAYGAVAMVLLILALRALMRGDRRPQIVVTVAMIGAALLFTASFLLIANACDYRYLYWLDVAAMAGLVRAVADRGPVSTPR
jgi:hypothetical protein